MDKNTIYDALEKNGLIVIKSDVFDIANRISAYDDTLVTVYNASKDEFQVWDTANFPNMMVATFAKDLDARLVEKVKRADNRTSYGMRAKLDEIKAEQEKREADEKKDAHEMADSMRRELVGADIGRKHFAKVV